MHVHPLWNDQYWPLIIKLYLAKPVGMKAMYSKGVVDLSMSCTYRLSTFMKGWRRWSATSARYCNACAHCMRAMLADCRATRSCSGRWRALARVACSLRMCA